MSRPFPRRRRLVVDSAFQYRFVALLVLQTAIILAILGVAIYGHLEGLRSTVASIATESGATQLKPLLDSAVRQYYSWSLVLVAATLVLLIGFGLLASHRLAGPVFKLKAYFRALAAGSTSRPIAFRRGDRLDAFAASINAAFTKEAERRTAIGAVAMDLQGQTSLLAEAGSADQAKAAVEMMSELVKRLKRWTDAEGQS